MVRKLESAISNMKLIIIILLIMELLFKIKNQTFKQTNPLNKEQKERKNPPTL